MAAPLLSLARDIVLVSTTLASPLGQIRERLGLLQLSGTDAVRKQLTEMERSLDEVERLVKQVTPPKH